ncbi:MAG: hypothetical protein KDD84_16100, partial [Caldilineaceae bacterium]|nr:hypothetical protein [Caldilineaceae bacterium]
GGWLLAMLSAAGAVTDDVAQVDTPTGHALIQVDDQGENAIILFGGANQAITAEDVDRVLQCFAADDYLLLQNEISQMPLILQRAAELGLRVVLNPAPMTQALLDYPLGGVSIFIVNETEGEALTGVSDPDAILDEMRRRFPAAATVLTLGGAGAIYADADQRVPVAAVPVDAVDTTAAGDTFTGYFLAGIVAGESIADALQMAAKAAAICVTRPGAADSIPVRAEVIEPSGRSG